MAAEQLGIRGPDDANIPQDMVPRNEQKIPIFVPNVTSYTSLPSCWSGADWYQKLKAHSRSNAGAAILGILAMVRRFKATLCLRHCRADFPTLSAYIIKESSALGGIIRKVAHANQRKKKERKKIRVDDRVDGNFYKEDWVLTPNLFACFTLRAICLPI